MTDNDIKEEFINMLEKHIGIVFKIATSYTYIREDREDLIHDIILELWKSFKRFDGSCKISTWLYRVALNISMNYKRKQKNTFLFISLNDFKQEEISAWLDEQEKAPELEILYSCIGELEKINKAIILLYLDGNSYEEISEITGISKTNVGTRICRIKEELRKIVISKI